MSTMDWTLPTLGSDAVDFVSSFVFLGSTITKQDWALTTQDS